MQIGESTLNFMTQNKKYGKVVGKQKSGIEQVMKKVSEDKTKSVDEKVVNKKTDIKVRALNTESYNKQIDESVEGKLTDEELMDFDKILGFMLGETNSYNNLIQDLKNHLEQYDKDIKGLEFIINNNVELPKGHTMDMVNDLLEQTKKMKQDYISKDVKNIEGLGYISNGTINMYSKILEMGEAGDLRFDSTSSDIIKDLGRISNDLDSMIDKYADIKQAVERELEARNLVGDEYVTYNRYGKKVRPYSKYQFNFKKIPLLILRRGILTRAFLKSRKVHKTIGLCPNPNRAMPYTHLSKPCNCTVLVGSRVKPL